MEKKFNHYFVDDKTSEYRTYEHKMTFRDKIYHYKTQDGVFSKGDIDDGSLFLVETALDDGISGQGLDLGCGYGAITMLLGNNCECEILACDINSRAVDLANENFRLNNVKAQAIVSDVGEGIEREDYDFVITNPPIRVGNATLFRFFEDGFRKLRAGGAFYAVLRKKQGAETYSKKIKSIFGNCVVLDKHKGYVIVKSIK